MFICNQNEIRYFLESRISRSFNPEGTLNITYSNQIRKLKRYRLCLRLNSISQLSCV